MVFVKTVSVLKKYSNLDCAELFPADEVAKLEAEIVSSLPRFFEASNADGLTVTVPDLNWKVARTEKDADGLASTLYSVTAFGMRDFFAIDEVMEKDADGEFTVFLSAHLV